MLDRNNLEKLFKSISRKMKENRTYLIELDSKSGDGDLGISMDNGFQAIVDAVQMSTTPNIGNLLFEASGALNEAAPSTLGTVLSIFLFECGRYFSDFEQIDVANTIKLMDLAVDDTMKRLKVNIGEKTIIDVIRPTVSFLKEHIDEFNVSELFDKAAIKAHEFADNTKKMKPVHGRAAYYGEKNIGLIDPGAEAGALIFEAISDVL